MQRVLIKNRFNIEFDKNLIVVHIPKDITDSEIDEISLGMWKPVNDMQKGFVCAIFGYDEDERELCDIPEVASLCQRLIERGLISLMHTSTLIDRDENPMFRRLLGAMEIWGFAHNLFKYNELVLSEAQIGTFLEDLGKSNVVLKTLVDKPLFAPEGQNRTKL